MAGGGGTGMRKYVGALKDSTTLSIAKVNSDYKKLDIAIVKATNHKEHPSKEKYIRDIFYHLSTGRARADTAYCIRALARRLSKTRNWAVALKTLLIIHRALREVDPTFREELISYGRSSSHLLHMSHFKDDSSSEAWIQSEWVRSYALYLEERLECFRVLNYDVETDPLRTRDLDTTHLLEQLPALEQLLFRLLDCEPRGSSCHNTIIQHAVSMVALESVRIHTAINDGILNLVDKFFNMQRDDAIRALDMYKRGIDQAGYLSNFYELCKTLHIGRGERLLIIEQPPASFLKAMEEYVRNAPLAPKDQKNQSVLAIEQTRKPEDEEASTSPPPPVSAPKPEPEPEPVKEVAPKYEPVDLLGMDEPIPDASVTDQNNALALVIVEPDNAPKSVSSENVATSWELALVTIPSSNENAVASSKLAGGLDLLSLDSLYDEAHRRAQHQDSSYNPWETTPASSAPMMMQQPMHNLFYASAQQQQAFMLQQQQHAFMLQQHQHAFMLQQQHHHHHQQPQQQQLMTMMAGQPVHQASSNPFAGSYMPTGGGIHYGQGMQLHAGGGIHYGQGMQLHAGNAYRGPGMM